MKTLAALLASLALALGALVVPMTAGSANAADCTYAPRITTVTKAARGEVNRFFVKVSAGKITPRGVVTVRVKRVSDGRIVKTRRVTYPGGILTINLGDRYTVGRKFVARFVGNPTACKYRSSVASVTFVAK